MRILRLDLQAFGPFTDRNLDLSAGEQGLHLVYGPNEAGKSSTLRALRQMLYGIDAQTADAFVHPYQNLRIGAKLRHDAGDELEFIRRKGNKSTLLATDGQTPLDDDALARFLGGISRTVFETMFGIDHERLAEGGQEIVKGHGELGQILFLAGSGISDLRSVQSGFENEIGALFKPKGQQPRINKALAELRDKRTALKQQQLSSDEWTRHRRGLENARKGQKKIERELQELQKEKNRLERVNRALPAISRLKQLRQELSEVADARILDSDFPRRRREAETSLQIAQSHQRQARERLDEIERQLADLNIPQDLLQRADGIDELYRRLGSHQKAMSDRVERVRECEQFEADACEMLGALRPDLDLDEAEQLRLTRPEQRRIRDLGARHEALTLELKTRKQAAAKAGSRIQDLENRLGALPSPPEHDPAELQDLLQRVRKHGSLDEQLDTERALCERLQREADIDVEALPLWSGDLEDLERLPVPANETIDRFDADFSDAEKQAERLRDLIEAKEDELRDIAGQIDQVHLEHKVPTEEDLTEARRERDAVWRLVRDSINGAPQVKTPAARAKVPSTPGTTKQGDPPLSVDTGSPEKLADAFEQAAARADAIADRLRREAKQVAHKARLLADREKRGLQLQRLNEQLVEANARSDRIRQEWTALWRPLRIEPFPPREMRVWAQQQRVLAERSENLRGQREKVAALDERAATHRGELASCLKQFGQSPGADEPLTRLIERLEEIRAEFEDRKRRREQIEADLAEARRDLPEAESAAERAKRDLAEWQSVWADDMQRLGLRTDATPGEANALLDAVDGLLNKISDIGKHRKRIEAIDADAEKFAVDVRALADAVAPELAELPAEQAASTLNVRLAEARAEQKRRESFLTQRDDEEESLQTACATIEKMKARLDAMCREAGCRSYDELPAAEERSAGRQEISAGVGELEDRIRRESAGATLEQFLEEAAAVDPDAIDFEVEKLTDQIQERQAERDRVRDTIRDEEHALARMDGNARAADLADDEQTILAQLESDVEQYVRLKLASTVLRAGIQRYREKNQTPVLKRTSELFSQLTLGSFAGLRDDYDEKGQAVLVGLRPGSDQPVPLDGMSDGACDQLYLALRIAGLETYLARHEPLPFIVDDVLVNFDNDRAVAALQTLADFSRRAQVIFFTHHEHLVDLARRHLDGGVLFVHHLGA